MNSLGTAALLALLAGLLLVSHASLLRLPYFWDEAGYYIPAARDLLAGSVIPHSTPSNAHPPLVMAWLAIAWKIFGQKPLVTRCAMLLLAASSLVGFFRLAKAAANTTVAAASTLLTAVYPVFFAQSSLAQIDLPAAGLVFWGLEAYVRRRATSAAVWFSLAALAKETAILVPIALFLWDTVRRFRKAAGEDKPIPAAALISPVVPLAAWYLHHYMRTGYLLGNPEFFRYNVSETLHPLRMVIAFGLRIWQTVAYPNLYVLALACLMAMRFPAVEDANGPRPRIDASIQLAFAAIAGVYLVALSAVGGAVLARYMLPIVPLFILVCVSTIWRRLPMWKAVLTVIALAFAAAIFVNPPYGFAPEDNLAYRDYVRLHQRAEGFLESAYPHARVLTAWPASDELSRPFLGYVGHPLEVLRIENFTAEQLMSAADARSRFDVALVFPTKYQPAHSFFDRWRFWKEWKTRYFGYHVELGPEAAASVLGGRLVYLERRHGQWVGIVEMQKIEVAAGHPGAMASPSLLRAPSCPLWSTAPQKTASDTKGRPGSLHTFAARRKRAA